MANKKQKFIMELQEKVINDIWGALKEHKKIKIKKIGIFEIIKVDSITNYNPYAKKVISKKAYSKIKFKPYKPLKEYLND